MKKINIVWLVNEKFTNNFSSFYKICKEKKSIINLKVIAVPHLGTISSKEISEYLTNNGIENIDCYDEKNNKYFDIKQLKPDYVFYTTPYNIYIPEEYRSNVVNKYSKVCCVSYGARIIKLQGLYKEMGNNSFIDDSYKIFVESKYTMTSNKSKYAIIGYLKLDNYTCIKDTDRTKIIWKPRWTLEQGDSIFFDYFDTLYNYFNLHENIYFSIYFHPLFYNKVLEKGYKEKYNECIKKINLMKNYIKCSDDEFLSDVLESDILIADHSSTIVEFFTTGKPIIYCQTKVKLNRLGKKIVKCSYQVKNEKELIKMLDRLLKGHDSKKRIRSVLKGKLFFVPTKDKKAADNLYEYLIRDSEGII